MFNATQLVIDAYVERLRERYVRVYGIMEPDYPGILAFVGRMALENIANTDAPYHDLFHTILVTEVGQEILLGKQLRIGGVTPAEWLHVVIALLCHDIGYVRGVCQGDQAKRFVTGNGDGRVSLPPGSTDAALTPYHVNRGQTFVRERFGSVSLIDDESICRSIENTRFPVPDGDSYHELTSGAALVRAADLIGQMADVNYLRKCSALFQEFVETGAAEKLGYSSADDLRVAYPKFFWREVRPYIGEALRYLSATQSGKVWVNNLYANVFIEEHQEDV